MLVVPTEGSVELMDVIQANLPSPMKVHLYVNDYSPDQATNLLSFTEASFPGYVPGSATFPNPATVNIDSAAEIDAAAVATFTSTGMSSQTAYGYWVDDGTYTSVWWAERFDSPVDFSAPGTFVQVLLSLTGITEFTG
jgi:hypothetical protein